MTDEEFDAWQLDVRKQLQEQVRAAYEVARSFPSALTQGEAYAISMYERMTRFPFDDEVQNTFRDFDELYKRIGHG